MSVISFVHEATHNFAKEPLRWSGLTPPPGSASYAAQQKEPPVTEYGSNAPVEDFAETGMLYATNRGALKGTFPLKYKAFHDLMEQHGGGTMAPAPSRKAK
jgi:hypothetical protein